MLLNTCSRPSRNHASALCGKIYFLHFYILLTVFFRIARAIRACWNGLGFWGRLPFVSFAMTGLCYGAWLLVMKVEVFLKCNDPNCWSCANTPMCIQCNMLKGLVTKHYSDFLYFFMAQMALLFAMLAKMILETLGGV